jgi:hypothetical protein
VKGNQSLNRSFIPPLGFGQRQDFKAVKAIAGTPAQDERPITPVIIKHFSVERVGLKPADVWEQCSTN